MPVRFSPSPVAQDENQQLRQYLDEEFRRVANSQPDETVEGLALLFDGAANVAANGTTETPILNYTESADSGVLLADPVLGTITLPLQAGLVRITNWITMNQVGAVSNFNVQLVIEFNGVWSLIGSAYIPQNAQDVDVGISGTATREVAGGEVLRWGLILDGAAAATFNIINCSFEVQYLTIRG